MLKLRSSSQARWRAALVLVLITALSGCADQSGQLATVQALADALRVRNLRAACALNIEGKQDRISCDGMLVPLLHYCPHFAGAKVQLRSGGQSWRFAKEVVLPVRYFNPIGKGDIDVTLRRTPQGWRIVSLRPLGMESNK